MVVPSLQPQSPDANKTVWVVFSDETDIRLLKILKHGFRHCFMIMRDGDVWVLVDPRANKTDIEILRYPAHFNVPRFFQNNGKTVTKVTVNEPPRAIAPLMPFSCVETIKRCLGIHRRFIVTPYQLYRHLITSTKG